MPYKRSTGEHKTWREFWVEFKQGMRNTTQYQQAIATQFGHVITAIGIVWGIIFSIRLAYYWMTIVLSGGFIVLSVQYLANWQRKLAFKEGEEWIKNLENEVSKTSG